MDARNSYGVLEKFSWALSLTAVIAACLALAEGGWAQGTTVGYVQERIQRLGDKDPGVRRDAIRELTKIGPGVKEAVRALSAALTKDPDSDVRREAAEELGDRRRRKGGRPPIRSRGSMAMRGKIICRSPSNGPGSSGGLEWDLSRLGFRRRVRSLP